MFSHEATPVLIACLGDRTIAIPSSFVDRVEPMAELTPLPGAATGVVGVLNVRGAVLPVVDPRALLDLPAASAHPSQHLLLISARTRYLLWVDAVERMTSVALRPLEDARIAATGGFVVAIATADAETIPVLSPEALDPGQVLTPAAYPDALHVE